MIAFIMDERIAQIYFIYISVKKEYTLLTRLAVNVLIFTLIMLNILKRSMFI